jgi:6-phosphogluconolactonase
MGADGHTASLFPGGPALEVTDRWVAAVDAPTTVEPALPRVTLTLPVLNCASEVLFLVSGEAKQEALSAVLAKPDKARDRYPAARVRGAVSWFITQDTLK